VSRPPRTLLELCVARAGGRKVTDWRAIAKGGRVATFLGEWAVASWDTGEPIEDVYALCRWWGRKRGSTAERRTYARWDEFRQLFPDLASPQVLVDLLGRPTRSEREPAAVLNMDLPAELAA
jgi:hypothetical protein